MGRCQQSVHWQRSGKNKTTWTDSLEPSVHGMDRLTNFDSCPMAWQHSQSWFQWTAPSFITTVDLLSQSPAHFMCHFLRTQLTLLFSLRITTCERPSTFWQEPWPSPRASDARRTITRKVATSVLATLILLPRSSRMCERKYTIEAREIRHHGSEGSREFKFCEGWVRASCEDVSNVCGKPGESRPTATSATL